MTSIAGSAEPAVAPAAAPPCRFCDERLTHTVIDLGTSPPCESFVRPEQLFEGEVFYPLHVWICDRCFLVQLEEFVAPEAIFTEYAYFSSYSRTMVEHARQFAEAAVERFGLSTGSSVLEVASNDGYLLQHFLAREVPVLGVEPAANVARHAEERGVRTIVDFFGAETARRVVMDHSPQDLVIGNNVLAQVPDLNDFVAGLAIVLADDGVLTLEFPHLMRLIERNQFDTIYHEHFSYFSFTTARQILAAHGLDVFDVDEITTHGGSLRLYAQRAGASRSRTPVVDELMRREEELGYRTLEPYAAFRERVEETKRALLEFLIDAKRKGSSIAGYGAPGKGNTLLNYCGIRTDFLDYTVDLNPYKHGLFLPGTHIPIHSPDRLAETKPDYVLILPWNLRDEIIEQLAYVRNWGGAFVIPIPALEIVR
jgi:C-methyltransferase-like protein/putative zinc binding protein/methyltransferase family protein